MSTCRLGQFLHIMDPAEVGSGRYQQRLQHLFRRLLDMKRGATEYSWIGERQFRHAEIFGGKMQPAQRLTPLSDVTPLIVSS